MSPGHVQGESTNAFHFYFYCHTVTSCLDLVDLYCCRSRNNRSTEYYCYHTHLPDVIQHTPSEYLNKVPVTDNYSIGFCQNGSPVLDLLQNLRRRHLRLRGASQMLLRQRKRPALYLQQGFHRECHRGSSMLVQISPRGTMYMRACRDREPAGHGLNLPLWKARRRVVHL